MTLEAMGLSLELDRKGLHAHLRAPDGGHWLTLPLFAAVDTVDAVDETIAVEAPRVEGDAIHVERRSTVWRRAGTTIRAAADGFEVETWVEGDGVLGDAHLLGGRSLVAPATGFFPAGSSFRTLFSPNPGDPAKLVRGAGEAAVIGVSGDGSLGRGHWFFTPAPLCLALHREELAEPGPGGEPWLTLSVAAPVAALDALQLSYRPGDRAFALVLEHEGHRRVEGRHVLPTLLLAPAPEPYAGLRAHRDALAVRGAAPPVAERERPAWWRSPIFCGWGAQCHLAAVDRGHAPDYATQGRYDAFLATLEEHGIVPPTVVLDDKWQLTYGENEPDPAKWPDLRGWIDGRHARGQHVLLWWKAWDPEGLPPELCIRTPDGTPLALDPTNPDAAAALEASIARMLGPDGLDADGLKIDFTARTPSGRALAAAGPGWGISLLHRLLSLVYAAAKNVNPDALVITHTPHPAFVDVTDMVRLNDLLRLDDPGPLPPVVPQMRYRAAVVAAACPDVLIDTDDWCVSNKEEWRAFLELKPELGVPSLYYTTHLDLTGEALDDDDYAAIRDAWRRWES